VFQPTWETIVQESVDCVDWIELDVVMSCLTGPITRLVPSRKRIRDCPLITAGLGRGCPDSLYDMDDTVFTGRCNTLTILSDKRFDIS
jgi:hypothetical protein